MHRTTFARVDKEQRREALIEAANKVFAEHGFDAATTREIAERAGCAEGLIHRYFAGKRGLLLAILDQRAAVVAEEFGADLAVAKTVEQELEQILLHELDAKWERRDFMRVCVSQAAIDPELGAAVRDKVQERLIDFIACRLRCHQQAGRIHPGVDIDAIAHAVSGIGFATGFMFQIAFGGERADAERTVRAAAAAIARGISTRPESAEEETP
jgi:AcrR family transcriptional regulator